MDSPPTVDSSFADGAPHTRVLVTGATGNIGSALLGELHGSGVEVVAALTCEAAKSRLPVSCDYRVCNYNSTGQMAAALDGIDAAFLLVPFDENMVAWGKQFIEQARLRGVGFIVRLSGLEASLDCGSRMGVLHGRIDDALKGSGIPSCTLRCNAFMQNFTGHYRGMIQRGLLSLPAGDARCCFIDTRDIGAVAAHIFSNPAPHVGRVYDLGGPQPLSYADATEIISEATGNPVEYRAISDAEARRMHQKFGVSPWRMDVLESLGRFIRVGHAGRPNDTFESLLGRRPGTFRDFVEGNRQCWTVSASDN